MIMAIPGFCRTSLAWAVTTSVSASISKTLYSPSFCWRPPCHVTMGCMCIVYSFRFRNDSIAKQYLSVNMVGGPPSDPGLTIFSLICLNFMRSLSLPHNPVTCVGLCLPDAFWILMPSIRPSIPYWISWTGTICTLCTAFIAKLRVSSMAK